MRDDLDTLVHDGLAAFSAAASLEELDAARTRVLGKKSDLAGLQRRLGGLDPEERRRLGQQVNDARARLTEAEQARRRELEEERDRVVLAAEAVDVTLPPRTPDRGSLHPLYETMEAMVDTLVAMGYRVVTGPEVESDWFNFDALNTPIDHPARTLNDTIYVQPLNDAPRRADGTTGVLLRTHTSPVQARTMLATPPPVYVIVPGRVYRQDTPDATHLPMFHQIEGLAVDRHLSMADLHGTLTTFARQLLGPDVRVRFRPHYFPFTEPSAELDAWYEGAWIELLGAGMVHPNVLRNCGYDPERVQGFAFGVGVDRIAMLRHGITDLRLLVEPDLRFLTRFALA